MTVKQTVIKCSIVDVAPSGVAPIPIIDDCASNAW